MTGHVHDELPMLLRGEADRRTVADTAAHLRTCEDCRQELISALVAHASLASAVRVAPELVAAAAPVSPPQQPQPLPDLSAMFAQIRAEEPETPQTPQTPKGHEPHRRSWRGRWLAAAAVAGVAIGAGAAVAANHVGSSPSTQTVRLAAFDKGTVPATAKVVGKDQMRLDAAALAPAGAGKLYEVWLTNAQRTRLYAVGSLGPDRKGTFTVAPTLMANYSAIEVSVQPLQTSAYSGVSVLRGSYG